MSMRKGNVEAAVSNRQSRAPAGRRASQRKKRYGIVYTPDSIVDLMLEKLPSLKDAAICDPACGDGQFLVAIAEKVCRKIQGCRSDASRRAYYGTLRKLVGMDIDKNALARCRARLNDVLKRHRCAAIRWQLRAADAIDRNAWADLAGQCDCVIGNPPYVRIQHLEARRRARIGKGQWQLIAGCSDLFILFFEMGLELLRDGGSLVFITPNSWLKSRSGRMLRECLTTQHQILSITDFGEHQVFENATTYTAITEIRKGGKTGRFAPGRKCAGFADGEPKFTEGRVQTGAANDWAVLSPQESRFIRAIRQRGQRLADVADVHVGLQTLADDVFIIKKGEVDIEPRITKRVLKASVMQNGKDAVDRIVIYPYRNGKLIPEAELRERYPKAYAYLRARKSRLLSRDKGGTDPRKWYGFGREVSIVSGFGEKILTSGMNPAPNFQQCPDADALFYGGYCVKPRPGVSSDALLSELNGGDMAEYIRLLSRPYKNGWYSYAKSYIQWFPVTEGVYESA